MVEPAADSQRPADDLRVGAKCASPVAVTEHHDRIAAACDIVRQEYRPVEMGLDAEEREAPPVTLRPSPSLPCPRESIVARGEVERRDAAEASVGPLA